jgi:hypothetical protein
MPGGWGQALPPTDWQCRVRCMWAAGCANAGRGTTGQERMIFAARKHRCICEAQARGRKRHSQTGHHDGDLEHMCRRTGERRWHRLDAAESSERQCGWSTRLVNAAGGSRRSLPRAPGEHRAQCVSRQNSVMPLRTRFILNGNVVVVATALVGLAKGSLVFIGQARPLSDTPTTTQKLLSRMAHELGVAVETGQKNRNSNPPAL